ncbi:MAG: PLDc N-terminal domain-containing protein [Gemmatimonadales bacterium]|nr:PLDc N-terminal domain-containing protein [Gemmatimonadales bacterium]
MPFVSPEALLTLGHIAGAALVTGHVLLTKKEVRAAIGWTGLAWLAPIVGPIVYLFFGINRIRRAAGRIREARDLHTAERRAMVLSPGGLAVPASLRPAVPDSWQPLATLTGNLALEPLVAGNSIAPLEDGDQAYPAMLAAIEEAERSIGLATYIFDRGDVGGQFVDALARAHQRGVEVRVLIDGVGARYSRPSIVRDLRRQGVRVAEFLPPLLPLPNPYFNLRSHRKILTIDGRIGFSGGINIRDACVLAIPSKLPTRDLHFRLHGPIVRQLQETFAFDWRFATAERLDGASWFPSLQEQGTIVARGLATGPDESGDVLLLTLLGALAHARRSIRIVTPYFLPDTALLDALQVAALRGVDVEILLPQRSNLRMVQWAQGAQLLRVLEGGCRVLLNPAPFDHSKLMVVDSGWTLIGSANWDPRSLRLNFEQVVECYCDDFAAQVEAIIARKRVGARQLDTAEIRRRPLPIRLRDGVAWLAQPYL